MAEKDSQSESQEQQPGRKFSEEQYDMLIRCSQKRDMAEWNKWRREHRDEEILLEGANLAEAHLEKAMLHRAYLKNAILRRAHLENASLEGANLQNADLNGAYLENTNLGWAHLANAILQEAHLENAWLVGAHLENAKLGKAHLENAILTKAHLENAELWEAHLENAVLGEAHLENTNLRGAHLENANLWRAHLENDILLVAHLENTQLGGAHLENANLEGAYLRGSDFSRAFLQGTNCSKAIVDGETLIWDCEVDRNTNFEGVGLDSARVQPRIKQLLEYNIRRMNWEDWYWGYKTHKIVERLMLNEKTWPRTCRVLVHLLLTSPIRVFWSLSDYGLRTWRIILWFFGLAIVFAFAYFLWPNCIMVYGSVGEIRGFVHALYFSFVTMTTLGFGDIAANPDSWQGQVLLMVQVILGYVLLGALVTRFAVLFTSGGPAGKFTPMSKETKKILKRLDAEKRQSL